MLSQTHILLGVEEKVVDKWGWTVPKEERSFPFLWNVAGLAVGLILPYLCFFSIVAVAKSCRARQLKNYVAEWNR